MDRVEERAAQALARVPDWLWDGEALPVPIEDIADSVYGLLVRDVEDMTAAPGAPALAPGQSLSGLLLAARGEIWVNADEARAWARRRGGGAEGRGGRGRRAPAAAPLHDRPRAGALGAAPRRAADAVLPL